MNERILQTNAIVKDLDILLRKIDKRVSWVDFIPQEMFDDAAQKSGFAKDLVVIGYKNGQTKYADVSGEKPFNVVRDVCNALDDFCVEKQFMRVAQIASIQENLKKIASQRSENAAKALSLLEELSDDACLEIYDTAQILGYVPPSYPANTVQEKDAKKVLIDYLKTDGASFIDTLMLLQKTEEVWTQQMNLLSSDEHAGMDAGDDEREVG